MGSVQLKRILLLLAFLFAAAYVEAQSNWLWQCGGSGNDEALANTTDAAGNIYTTGYFSLYAQFGSSVLASSGGGDVFVVKQNNSGAVLWAVKAGGSNSDRGTSIATDAGGNVYVCGHFSGTAMFGTFQLISVNNTEDIFVAKLDAAGNFVWAERFGGDNIELALGITIDAANNVLLTGQFKDTVTFGSTTLYSTMNPSSSLPSYDIFLLKLDANGNCLWVKQGATKFDARGLALTTDDSCNIYMTGQFSDTLYFSNAYYNTGYNIGFIIKVDSAGQDVWFKRLLASFVTAYSIVNSGNSFYVTGDFLGQLNVQSLPVTILTNPNPNKIFLIKITNSGGVTWAKSEGSANEISSLDVAVDTLDNAYITGTFRCRFTDYSALYDSAIFYSVGARDVYVAKYSSAGQRLWQRHFAGPRDDYCSAISVYENNNPVISGSFESVFNVPRGNNFTMNSTTVDYSGLGPVQLSNYCSGANYNSYISVKSNGFKDIFLSRPVDTLRNLYDYYDRLDTGCVRDSLFPYINNNEDTLIGCDHTWLFASLRTGRDGLIGPEYNYMWSDSSTNDSLNVTATGWYRLTVQRKDGCLNSVTDSIYVIIYPIPNPPVISNINGYMQSAIPMNSCLQKLVVVWPDTAYLIGSGIPPGYSYQWNTPLGNMTTDTIRVDTSGSYSFVIVSPVGNCTAATCIDVYIAYPDTINGNGWCPNNFVPEIHFTDSTFDATDTVTVCYGDHFEMVLTDSTYWANQIPVFIIAYAYWQLQGGFNFDYYDSYPYTFIDHHQRFQAFTSGNCTVTVTIMDPTNGFPYTTISRNFYLHVNPLPVLNAQWSGPAYLCPGDTALLQLTAGFHYNITGNNIISYLPDSTGIYVVGAGTFQADYSVTDSVTGCSDSDAIVYVLQSSPPPRITMLPANGIICPNDSVLLVAENGSNYTWYGPLGNPIGSAQSIYVNAPGYYHYVFTDSAGCILVSEFAEVKEYSTPSLTVFPGAVLCAGDSIIITLSDWDSSAVQWLPPLSGNAFSQTVYAPGVYSCQVNACNTTTIVSVEVLASTVSAQITASSSLPICPGDTVILQGPANMAMYTWQPGNLSTPFIIVTSPGTYYLQVNDFNMCPASDSVVVDSISNPVPPTINDTTICSGQSVLLTALASGTVHWYDSLSSSIPFHTGSSYQTSTIDSTTTFYLTNSDTLCESIRIPVNVFVNPVSYPPFITGNNTVCLGDTVMLSVTPQPGVSYIWSGPNNFQDTSSTVYILASDSSVCGFYYIFQSDNLCTSGTDSVLVSISTPQVAVNLSGANPHCPGTSVVLSATDTSLVNYQWLPTMDTTSLITVNDTGTFVLVGTDPYGCSDTSAQITITLLPLPTVPVANDTSVCAGDSAVLFAISSGQVTWYDYSANLLFTGNPFITPPLADTTIYLLSETDTNGCVSLADTVQVIILPPLPPPVASSNAPLCEGDTLFLFTGAVAGATYQWSGPNGFNSAAQNPVIVNVTPGSSGIYSVIVNGIGCPTLPGSVNVLINPAPPIPGIDGDTVYCDTEIILLNATNVSGTLIWNGPNNFQSTSATVSIPNSTVINSGVYTVVITSNGCTSSASVTIIVNPLPVAEISANSLVCMGDNLEFSTTLIAGATYQWTGPNNYSSGQPFNLISNADTTMNGYYYVIVSALGCNGTADSVLLRVVPYPVFDLGNDTTFCQGNNQVTLTAPPGFDAYEWSTGANGNSISVNSTGTYVLTITNFPDCKTTDEIKVETKPCAPVVPNVFTPNNDGPNDSFYITFEGAKPIDMVIFNRWGELIRKLEGPILKWDGKNKIGRDVPDGVYYYIAHYINNYDEIQTFAGFVELIR